MLSLEDIAILRDEVGPECYRTLILAHLKSGRATAAEWRAVGEAVLEVSMAFGGEMVESIDRVVLATYHRWDATGAV